MQFFFEFTDFATWSYQNKKAEEEGGDRKRSGEEEETGAKFIRRKLENLIT